ncbi:hypothetical protein [Schaalia vaccimaxillae]|uniref:hypothetical protein n=1 Tax=Schaalia vaccimaxillae TaxID=183916 RepID=UPI000427FADE|nr:hypothetical protein [Schaalia vaccimaxillae]
MKDGRIALLVYTALDRLKDRAGEVPWALLDWPSLGQLQKTDHFDLVIPDVVVPFDKRDTVQRGQ